MEYSKAGERELLEDRASAKRAIRQAEEWLAKVESEISLRNAKKLKHQIDTIPLV